VSVVLVLKYLRITVKFLVTKFVTQGIWQP
jgi:hypothetical protein